MTLVEVMISFAIFAFAATAVMSGLIQAHKLSSSNLAQSYAASMAQSLMEEVIRVSPSVLADPDETSISIKLATLRSGNYTSIDNFSLPWSTSSTTYTSIGTTTDGILTDAAYEADSNTIRPERFMHMRVNLQREIESTNNRVRITLRYQWEVPDRKQANGDPLYLSGEIRTVRSTALRF